jgi:hypothetical protein
VPGENTRVRKNQKRIVLRDRNNFIQRQSQREKEGGQEKQRNPDFRRKLNPFFGAMLWDKHASQEREKGRVEPREKEMQSCTRKSREPGKSTLRGRAKTTRGRESNLERKPVSWETEK